MKQITKIEYQQKYKDRVNVYIDGSFEFGLNLDIMIKYGLSKGMNLEDEFISEILKAEDKSKTYNYAISFLSKRARSERELRNKLTEKGYEIELIDDTIDKLIQNKYIDDSDYSEKFIADKINFSKDGKGKIQSALYNKGISPDIIKEKLSIMIDPDDEVKRAEALGEKKLRALMSEEPQKQKAKLSGFLLRKGFDYRTVNKAMNKLLKSDYYEDEFEE